MSAYKITIKTLALGDAAVGKTSLIRRFVHEKFDEDYKMTIGMEPYSRYETIDDTRVSFSLWDIAGQDRFEKMRGMFYKGAQAAFVTFDLTRMPSFKNVENWINEAKEQSPAVEFILVGNKNDLKDLRVVTEEMGRKKAEEMGAIGYIETSALTGDNVKKTFRTLGRTIINNKDK